MTNAYGTSLMVRPGEAAPAIEARTTAPEDPGGGWGGAQSGALSYAAWQLGHSDQWGEYSYGADVAMTYSAVFACVRVISQTLASVGWHTYEKGADGRSKMPLTDDVSWLVDMQANPEVNAFDWRQTLLKDALLGGNGYAEIERLNNGKPAWMWRIDPDRVTPVRDEDGRLWYEVHNGVGKESSYLRPEDVFHLKGVGPDGLVGWSVVRLARNSIKLGLAEERFGLGFFERGPMPGGFISLKSNANEQQRKEYRRSFEEVYSGSRGQHRVVVMSGGDSFTPASLPNDDAQFLESRVFQVNEICRWYGVPPHKLADLSRATFSNIEEQERAFVADCILPWARRLESEADVKLYGRTNRGRRFTRLNLDALQRGNSQTQTETVTKKVAGGLMTPNEGREFFDMNPRDEGDSLLVQGAMTTLESVVEGEAAEPVGATSDARQTPQEQAPPMEDVRRTFKALLAEAYFRLYRVDADKAKRAANKGRLSDHLDGWLADPAATQRVCVALLPTFEALCLSTKRPTSEAGVMASCAAGRYLEGVRLDLDERGARAADTWESLPTENADEDLRRALE